MGILIKLFLVSLVAKPNKTKLGYHFIGTPRPSIKVNKKEGHPFGGSLAQDTTKEERDSMAKKTLWFDDVTSMQEWNDYCSSMIGEGGQPVVYVHPVSGEIYSEAEAKALSAGTPSEAPFAEDSAQVPA